MPTTLKDGEDCSHLPLDESADEMEVDGFYPNMKNKCMVCGQIGTVCPVKDNVRQGDLDLCGPHTWGQAAMLDPAAWNK